MRHPTAGADLAALDNLLVTQLDLTDGASIAAAIEGGIARIDARVNNAG